MSRIRKRASLMELGTDAWESKDYSDSCKKKKIDQIEEKESDQLFKDFTQETTLHGLRQVMERSVFAVRRILWLGVLVACLCFFVDYAYERVRTYMRYDIKINVQFDYVDSLEFPAVTICNTNTFKLSKSVEHGFFKEVQQIMDFRKQLKGPKRCNPSEEFECQHGECVSKDRLCDFFPDCSNKADEQPEKCHGECQIVCVDEVISPSESARSLEGRCFTYDRPLQIVHQLQNQAFFSRATSDNQTDLYLFHEGARWVIAEKVYSCVNCKEANRDTVVAYWPTTQDRLIFNQWHRWARDPVRVESNSTNSSTTVIPTTEPTTLDITTANRRDRCRTTMAAFNWTLNATADWNSSTSELDVTTGTGATTGTNVTTGLGVTIGSDATTGMNSTTGMNFTTGMNSTNETNSTTWANATAEPNATIWFDDDCLETTEDELSHMDIGPGIKVGLMLSCHADNVTAPQLDDVLEKLQPKLHNADRTLSELYEITAPRIRDTLIKCTWRGEPCSHVNFTEKYTDMGLCFTFVASQPATLPGLGYGLGLTLNIENYDYTSRSDDGVGVRVLLHDDKDEPVMDQNSFALSPGRYTLVSVDRTKVNGLPKPWGDCGHKKLRYYSVYSMATCKLECENNVIRRECHCRDVYMPAIGDEPVCDISTYLTCGQKAIEMDRKLGGNACRKCASPCQEEKYVPSMSFSALSTKQDDVGSAMSHLKLRIAAKVQAAREYSYRLQTDKYWESLRMFSSVAHAISNAHALLGAVLDAFANDRNEVRMRVAEVETDCVWFTSGQNQLVRVLEDEFLAAGLFYKKYIKNDVLKSVRGLINTVSLGKDNDEKKKTEEWRVAIKDRLYDLVFALERALDKEVPQVVSRIETSSTTSHLPLRLQSSEIQPLLLQSRVKCPDCLVYEDTLLNGLKKQLLELLQDDVSSDLRAMKTTLRPDYWSEKLDKEYWEWDFFKEENFLKEGKGGAFVKSLEKLENQVKTHIGRVDNDFAEPTRTTLAFVEELMRLTATKCGSELLRPLEGYMDSHARMQIVLEKMIERIINYNKIFGAESKAYVQVNISLAEMAEDVSLSVLAANLRNDLAILNGLLDQRNISLLRTSQYINVINYWLLAQASPETLRERSKYWKSLGIENPEMVKPILDDPELVAGSEKFAIADEKMESYWKELSLTLNVYRKRAAEAVSRFESETASAKHYLEGYLRGNELEESFLGENVLQLEIFYRELAEKKVDQSESYHYQSFLGEVGGLMGLLLGCSAMTLIEILEFVLILCGYKCLTLVKKASNLSKEKPSRLDAESC